MPGRVQGQLGRLVRVRGCAVRASWSSSGGKGEARGGAGQVWVGYGPAPRTPGVAHRCGAPRAACSSSTPRRRPQSQSGRTEHVAASGSRRGPRSHPRSGRDQHDHALRGVDLTEAPPTYRAGTRPSGHSGSGSPGAGKHVETREGCCRPCLGAGPPVSAPTGAVTRARAPPSRWVERAIWACALGLFSACALCQARGAVGVARVGVRGLRPVAAFQCAFQPGLGRRSGRVGGWPAGGWANPLVVRVWGKRRGRDSNPRWSVNPILA